MKEARFISRNKDKWKNMENGQQPDAEHLAANFIELSDDLAYARFCFFLFRIVGFCRGIFSCPR